MRLELRPERHEHPGAPAEQDDVEQRDADVARAQLPAQRDDQRTQQHRDARDDQAQLRAVLLLQRALEPKRPHCREACQQLAEVRVQ